MNTIAKFVAAAALAAVSVSSFASQVSWTGSLANVKAVYFPSNAGIGKPALSLTGTGSTCTFVQTGLMILDTSSAEAAEVRKLHDFIVAAKAANATVTLTYDNATQFCNVVGYSR